jgi:hypothetical protein
VEQLLERREASLDALLADGEELLLRLVDLGGDVRRVLVANCGNAPSGGDQVALDALAPLASS